MRRVKGKYVVLGIVLVFLGLLVFAGFKIKQTVDHLLAAETKLQCMFEAERMLWEYLEQTDPPAWPTSWDDLSSVSPGDQGPFRWPRDRELIESQVEIDFTLTLSEVAAQDRASFSAVRQTEGPSFAWSPDSILQAAREAEARLRQP